MLDKGESAQLQVLSMIYMTGIISHSCVDKCNLLGSRSNNILLFRSLHMTWYHLRIPTGLLNST